MTYKHRMTALPATYDTAATEKKWQREWHAQGVYAWVDDDAPENARANSFVIDTPPPTVSGTLHMGHVYSYTQADFIARFQRMTGKNVFYPMGFDDNGLPTERLVEKARKLRATDMSREAFIEQCMGVSDEARKEFRALFESIALSVDWAQEYHTISAEARRLSQLSFLDLIEKGECYRAMRPFYWDPVDQTAIAQAEIVDKEMASFQHVILFELVIPGSSRDLPPLGSGALKEIPAQGRDDGIMVPVMTTRPELLPACVALMYHPDDADKYAGKRAITPLFNIEVPMIADEKVDREKGTGLVMCCTFGDDTDVYWWEKHKLSTRVILNKYGKLDLTNLSLEGLGARKNDVDASFFPVQGRREASGEGDASLDSPPPGLPPQGGGNFRELFDLLQNKKTTNADPKNPGAREIILAALKEAGLLIEQTPITHSVKCAERSGAPLEILPTQQWFVKVIDKKEALKQKARECVWNPEWMRLRIEQWIDGLNQDWCISRQRYFGVPFPVWYILPADIQVVQEKVIYAEVDELPINPLKAPPRRFKNVKEIENTIPNAITGWIGEDVDGKKYLIRPDPDVMDTWATSSISPQLSAHSLTAEGNPRFEKLFPADLRPQAHEIIRTWAFYTIVKAHLHNDSVPWKNLMISGWCLAEDKSKMSKSKGNMITPVALIEDKGADAVRYWAATSRLGQDTTFSPDLLKIGKKLVNKLWNATAFAAIHLEHMSAPPTTAKADVESGAISEILDQWILARLGETIAKVTAAYEHYEYADALDATNQFFWADFCDNYLELIKSRIYNMEVVGEGLNARSKFTDAQQQSAIRAVYYCLDGILKLYAPVMPHVTEELYSHIFAEAYAKRGSLHGRGMWPKAADFPAGDGVMLWGELATNILEQIRKAKSDAKRSIKTPVTLARIHLPPALLNEKTTLASMIDDVKGAGNIEEVALLPASADTAPLVEVNLAAEVDAA